MRNLLSALAFMGALFVGGVAVAADECHAPATIIEKVSTHENYESHHFFTPEETARATETLAPFGISLDQGVSLFMIVTKDGRGFLFVVRDGCAVHFYQLSPAYRELVQLAIAPPPAPS